MLADIEAGESGYGHRQGHEPVRAKLLAGRVLHGNAVPSKRVCVFIAVNDNVDSASEGMDNDFTPLRNLFNEWLVRDTSKKIKAVKKSKGNERQACYQQAGLRLCDGRGREFYYRRGSRPGGAADLPALPCRGTAPTKIARMLTEQQIPTPGDAGISADRQHPPLSPRL